MSAAGPVTVGGAQVNNANSVSIKPTVAVPAGALIFLVMACSAADTAIISASDTKGNVYNIQSQNQPVDGLGNLAPMSLLFMWARVGAQGLATTDTITVNADAKYQMLVGAVYYTGAQGLFTAFDIEYNQGTGLSYSVPAQAGQNLFAMVCVNGPQSDGFVQAAGWGADVGNGAGNAGFSIHGAAMVAAQAGQVAYAPTLGRARWSCGFLLAFS